MKKIIVPALPSVILIFIILFNNYTITNQDLMCLNLKKYVGDMLYVTRICNYFCSR